MGSASFVIERADTQAARAQGLSNRDSLPANQSLLFVFDESERHCFWMKDMRFPIDMIWINDEKRVVHIEQSVKPESYPESFCPPSVARYVIEVNAGQVSQSGITAGDTVSF